jgi:predicted deacylase
MVRYGAAEARPKAYIHAALHADETPGILVAHHLMRLLDAAEARGGIAGQVVLVPYANPIGLAQYINGDQFGRHDLNSGANFNRGWPDLFGPVAERVDGHLGGDAEANVEVIRKAMRGVLDSRAPTREIDSLRLALAREACDADFVLDLHCDDEGLMHLFLVPSLWPAAADLAGELECRAVMLADDTGGATFAESFARPWSRLALSFPGYSIPQACFSATVELRGFADVSDELAEKDALALFRELRRRGHVAGEPGPAPTAPCEAAGFDACDVVRAPFAGVVSYRVELGQHVERGEAIADLLDPAAAETTTVRHTIHADTDGLVLSRRLRKLVTAGEVIAKIVGKEPLTHRQGYLLED